MAHDARSDATGDVPHGMQLYLHSRRAGLDPGLAAQLTQFIAATEHSLDCAIYDLRYPAVVEALVAVARSGKRLRIAYDSSKDHVGGLMADPKPSGTIQVLEYSGLMTHATPVHHGRQLMHDKFLVRDSQHVWTGSANFTAGGLELQDNNCLAISSTALAAAYTSAFEVMLSGEYGAGHVAIPPLTIAGATITPYFSPPAGERVEQMIGRALAGARRVRVLAFLISDPGILASLAPFGANPAFDIRGVYDPNGMENVLRYTRQDRALFWFLRDPRFVAAPTHAYHPGAEQDFMHDKLMIVDDRLVITGSYNFSENAEANDENVLVIESPQVAAAYTAYFDALYATYGGKGRTQATAGVAASGAQPQQEVRKMEIGNGPRAHVLKTRPRTGMDELSRVTSRQRVATETVAGQTQDLVVYSDGSSAGNSSAQAVLATGEADYQAVRDWFGGLTLPPGQPGDDQNTPRTALPIHVLMDSQAGGAYHYGCNATDVYIEPVPSQATGLVVAEVVEIFEAAINNGWDCGHTNGESLSRVLAVARNSSLASLIVQTAQGWWSNGYSNYVTDNSNDDTDQDANGCGSLFMYYLQSQLGFSWKQITTTGGSSLGDTYQKLTGKDPSAGFNDFVARLATIGQGGQLNLPASGNPFPIGATAQPPADPGGSVALPSLPGGGSMAAIIGVVVLIILVALAIIGVLTGAIHLG